MTSRRNPLARSHSIVCAGVRGTARVFLTAYHGQCPLLHLAFYVLLLLAYYVERLLAFPSLIGACRLNGRTRPIRSKLQPTMDRFQKMEASIWFYLAVYRIPQDLHLSEPWVYGDFDLSAVGSNLLIGG
jgi:hypothetical protein